MLSVRADFKDIERIRKKIELLKETLISFSAREIAISATEFYEKILYYLSKDPERISGVDGGGAIVGQREGFPILELSQAWIDTKRKEGYAGRTIGFATGEVAGYFFDEKETIDQKIVMVNKKSAILFAGFNQPRPSSFPNLNFEESADRLDIKIYGMEFGFANPIASAPPRPAIRPAIENFKAVRLGEFRDRMRNMTNRAIILFGINEPR